ncbi:hypothetical protein LEP1GSC170_1733, partial [Leptospira interrogans serovar Bataviae str. HAI135]
MDILLLDDGQKIESALVEGSVGTDSLLVPGCLLESFESPKKEKRFGGKLPFLLRKYSK